MLTSLRNPVEAVIKMAYEKKWSLNWKEKCKILEFEFRDCKNKQLWCQKAAGAQLSFELGSRGDS